MKHPMPEGPKVLRNTEIIACLTFLIPEQKCRDNQQASTRSQWKATNSEDEPRVYLMQILPANGFKTSFVRWLSIRINFDASSGPGPCAE